jgi:hypothetical protein
VAAIPTVVAMADPRYTFTGWSGSGCTGTGGCTPGISAATNEMIATFTIIPAALSLTPDTRTFGSVTVGQTSGAVSFAVKNTGGATTAALSVGVDDASYVLAGTCTGAVLAASETCTVTVQLKPLTAGSHDATLTVGATGLTARTAALSGTGLTPGALAFMAPAALDFMAVPVLSESNQQTVTLINTGQSPTGVLGAATLSDAGSFAVSASTCPSVLGPNATCTISVTFGPLTAGAKSGSLTIAASPGGTASATLQGTGTAQVVVTNSGGGTVTSSPGGSPVLGCGATCASTYASGPVTLTATPDSAHTFGGWSGGAGCTGTGTCTLPLGAPMNPVTATFCESSCPSGNTCGTWVNSCGQELSCGADCAVCGNGVCESGEAATCPDDCPNQCPTGYVDCCGTGCELVAVCRKYGCGG